MAPNREEVNTLIEQRHNELKRLYNEAFDAQEYQGVMSDFSLIHRFFLMSLHNYFKRRDDLNEGSWILDVGCGPTAYAVLSASRNGPNIVLADLVQQNVDEIEKWRNANPDAFDLSFLTQYVAELEGASDIEERSEHVAERTRVSIRHVVRCDVTKPGVLFARNDEYELITEIKYDVIVTSTCLEAATLEETTYQAAVKNLSKLLKPNGSLVQCGLTGASEYTIGDVTFQCMRLNETLVKQAAKAAGLNPLLYRTLQNDIEDFADKFDTAFVFVATKSVQ